MSATRKQSMFVTVAGDVVFATDPEAATGDFSTHRAALDRFLDEAELDGLFRCRFYEGASPPRVGQRLENVDGIEWTWTTLR